VKRKGFTLIELMVVIAIIIILAAIAIPNYLKMTERAKNSRLQSDMATLATCLETFKTDWGVYPTSTTDQAVNSTTTLVFMELAGTAHTSGKNIADAVNAVGEKNPATWSATTPFIEYLKAGTMGSMVNPFDTAKPLNYRSNTAGTAWILWVDRGLSPNPVMYRTDSLSTPSYVTASSALSSLP
jgi:prepilin-type N-terminal cleavage/methylation domain-containing protein